MLSLPYNDCVKPGDDFDSILYRLITNKSAYNQEYTPLYLFLLWIFKLFFCLFNIVFATMNVE